MLQKHMPKKQPDTQYYREMTLSTDGFWKYSDPILRPCMPIWDIRIVENEGSKKLQQYIGSISYWNIVDELVDTFDYVHRFMRDRICNIYNISRIIVDDCYSDEQLAVFRKYEDTAEYEEDFKIIYELINAKLEPLINECLENYDIQFPEEYESKNEKEIIEEAWGQQEKQEREEEERQKAEYKHKNEETFQEKFKDFFDNAGGTKSMDSTQKEMAMRIIKAGYRALSTKCHPDAGGSQNEFILRGKVKEILEQQI